MGLLFLREFEDPDADQYLCQRCNIPIALQQDFRGFSTVALAGLFEKAINIFQVLKDVPDQVGPNKVRDIYCIKCSDKLGDIYVEIGLEEHMIKKDNVTLYLGKLLRKQGDIIEEALTPGSENEDHYNQMAENGAREEAAYNEGWDWEEEEEAAPPDEMTVLPLYEEWWDWNWDWLAADPPLEIVIQPLFDTEGWEAADPPSSYL